MTTTQTISEARNRLPAQQWAEGALAQHPHRLELKGSTESIVWPAICAYCGARADERIPVRKFFRRRPRRRRGSTGGPRAGMARVPFCSGCAQQHRATQQRDSHVAGIIRGLFHPLIIPVVGSAYFGQMAFRAMPPVSSFSKEALLAWGIPAFFGASFLWSLFLLWQVAIRKRTPPQTEITLACDFSEDVSQPFERERHIYAMRNKAFADGLATLNPDRVWTDQDQASSRRKSNVLAVVLLGVILLAWLSVYIFRMP